MASPESPDHQGVCKGNENLAELTGGQRQGEAGSETRFMDDMAEHSGNKWR